MGALTLQRGGQANLSREAVGLQRIVLLLEWQSSSSLPLSPACFMLGCDGKLSDVRAHLSCQQPISNCGAVQFSTQILSVPTTDQSATCFSHRTVIDLSRLPEEVEKIIFSLGLSSANANQDQAYDQNLSHILRSASWRCLDARNGAVLTQYDVAEDSPPHMTVLCGEVARNGIEWKIKALGKGFAGDQTQLVQHFGWQTEPCLTQ